MSIKFYSWWTELATEDKDTLDYDVEVRGSNNEATQKLSNELETVLGDYELVSLTSSATNGIVVTTIAYEVPTESVELPE
jgi:hypothetical protein